MKQSEDQYPPEHMLLQPKNQSEKYDYLFTYIDSGRIKIPMFQRDFVWDKVQSAKLIDSIIKGFPIGTFIFWKTFERLREVRNIGNARLPDTPKGDAVLYVLDGQQRITSLYAVRKGLIIDKEGKEVDYKDVSIRLNGDPDNEEIVTPDPPEDDRSISVHTLLKEDLTDLMDDFSKEELKRLGKYKEKLNWLRLFHNCDTGLSH